MTEELKPCPFCGGAAEIEDVRGGDIFMAHCKADQKCGSVVAETKAEVAAKWNARA